MTSEHLDHCYTELAQALERVGPERATLMLATLALRLMSQQPGAETVLPLIAQAERLSKR